MISERMISLVANSSAIRAMFEEGKKLAAIHGAENVYDYSLGNPNVEPPETVKAAIFEILNNEKPNLVHGYMNNSGYVDVREAIASHINRKYDLETTMSNIIMTCGAAGGLNIFFKSLINPGDEVIAIAPFFGEYRSYTSNYDAKLVVVEANIETFEPNIEDLKAKINSSTRAVIINSPNNPTGVVYSDAVLKSLAEALSEKELELGTSIFLVSDEPYREIAYDGFEIPYVLNYYRNSLVCYSYSKSLSLPGERIGYIVSNPEMDSCEEIMAALNVANRVLGFINAPSLFQRVIAKCLDAEVGVHIYEKNRNRLYDHLISLGFTCVKPQGAFYLFPRAPIADDRKFCEDAKQFNLLIVPGSAFGCPGHFRIAYCVSYSQIENSLQAFDKLAALYDMK